MSDILLPANLYDLSHTINLPSLVNNILWCVHAWPLHHTWPYVGHKSITAYVATPDNPCSTRQVGAYIHRWRIYEPFSAQMFIWHNYTIRTKNTLHDAINYRMSTRESLKGIQSSPLEHERETKHENEQTDSIERKKETEVQQRAKRHEHNLK